MASPTAIRTVAGYALIATLACVCTSRAQPPAQTPAQQTPTRDAGTVRPASGTAVIRGHVVAADGNRPLRRVQVRAIVYGAANRQPRTTSTDESGEYELTDLPAGRYSISAVRGGFLTLNY